MEGPGDRKAWPRLGGPFAERCFHIDVGDFPRLSIRLPEILLGGSFHGVKLQDDVFLEPGSNPAIGGSRGSPLEKWRRGALQRQERFQHVMHALGAVLALGQV